MLTRRAFLRSSEVCRSGGSRGPSCERSKVRPADQIIARGTSNGAKTIPGLGGFGTLRVGAPADVAVLELRDGAFEFVDNANTKRTGKQKLFASATVFGGKRVT